MSTLLIIIGIIVFSIYYCVILANIFKVSRIHGWISFFVPVIVACYVVMYWNEMKRSFFISLLGFALMIVGFYLNKLI